jgi:hypothetical protein
MNGWGRSQWKSVSDIGVSPNPFTDATDIGTAD